MKRVTILGATGSIGTQTLDVISQNSDDFEVVALTASESVEKMAELIQCFCPSYAVMKNEEKAEQNFVLFHRLTLKERGLRPNGYFPLMRQPPLLFVC